MKRILTFLAMATVVMVMYPDTAIARNDEGYVNVSGLHLRSSPNSTRDGVTHTDNVITTLSHGDKVVILANVHGWLRVQSRGREGYVWNTFITVSNTLNPIPVSTPVPTPVPTPIPTPTPIQHEQAPNPTPTPIPLMSTDEQVAWDNEIYLSNNDINRVELCPEIISSLVNFLSEYPYCPGHSFSGILEVYAYGFHIINIDRYGNPTVSIWSVNPSPYELSYYGFIDGNFRFITQENPTSLLRQFFWDNDNNSVLADSEWVMREDVSMLRTRFRELVIYDGEHKLLTIAHVYRPDGGIVGGLVDLLFHNYVTGEEILVEGWEFDEQDWMGFDVLSFFTGITLYDNFDKLRDLNRTIHDTIHRHFGFN